jgi:hypothetical protein
LARAAIEIHDAGVLAVGEDGGPLAPPSPGCALVEGEALVAGREAQARSRLRPRQVHDRFWADLDTTPLGRPFRGDRSCADLAHAHLSAIWDRVGAGLDAVILAVPGSWTERQLGLLLGIAGACGMPVRGLVDAAVSACAGNGEGRLLHLDLQLHRAVLTELAAGQAMVRRSVRAVDGAGLRTLRDAWLRRVADRFVQLTRFDPLHAAEAEQDLFDRLPALLRRLGAEQTAPVTVGSGPGRTVEVTRADLADAAAPTYELLERLLGAAAAGGPSTLLLSAAAAAPPGLAERLADRTGLAPRPLPAEAAAAGALAHRESIESPGEALPFVTRLPARPAAPPAGAGSAEGAGPHGAA